MGLGHQRTIYREVNCEGIGLHSGTSSRITLRPAPANTGIVFCRQDLPGSPLVEARPENILDVYHATTLAKGKATVKTVEHLLSALAGMGVDNLIIELEGEEIPVLDGSSRPFVELINRAGIRRLLHPKTYLKVNKRILVQEEKRSIQVVPSDSLKVFYTMCFDHPILGEQSVAFCMSKETYASEIAPSRTYGFLKDVYHLREKGLALGGSLENSILVGEEGVLNGGLRYPDELVRHKVLDLLGDLCLLGKPLVGTVIAYGAGHCLHTRLVKEIQRQLDMEEDVEASFPVVIEKWVKPLLSPEEPVETMAF